MRVGIVGMGFIGVTHYHAWRKTPAQLVGVYTQAMREPDLPVHQFSSYEELLDNVDVVDICTPTHIHHELVIQAAEAGKHIICEKPLARTIPQARSMIEAATRAGVQLLVAHVVRFFPEYALAQKKVNNGDIGQVAIVRLTRASFKPTRPEGWFHDYAKSGGMVMDLMIHDFDYARWIAGNVVSVYARSASQQFSGVDGDYCLAVLTHENGAISNVEGGWIYPDGMFRTALEVAGSHGLIEHPYGSSQPLGIHMKQKTTDQADIAVPASPLAETPFDVEIQHFYDVLQNGTSPRVTMHDALEALRVVFAVQKSIETGQPILMQEVE